MKIAALVSGGVDSSVALALAKEKGHDITAYYLKIWLEDDVSSLGECPWEDDLEMVEQVCKQLNVPLKIINLQKQYWEKVVNYCIEQVKLGKTPNPDMLCNSRVKFAAFADAIKNENYDKIITGHYADVKKIQKDNKTIPLLARVRDQIKDQTYFLANLNAEQIAKAHFPLAPYLKSEVRELAHKFNLPNKDRKESQGICFLGKIKYSDFIKNYLKEQPGDIIDINTNQKLGTHKGFWYHTIGQRKGMGLGGGPWIVVKKDTAKNIVYVSNEPLEKQDQRSFKLTHLNWITQPPQTCKVKLRHGAKMYNCTWSEKEGQIHVTLAEPDEGIAAGQYAVFYDEQYCYGCGVIDE